MHMGGGLHRRRAGVRPLHYAEILAGVAPSDDRLPASTGVAAR
jgi:L-lactate dehydrogenase complex protein LldE